MTEIRIALSKMKKNKACGDDGIVVEAIKTGALTLLKKIRSLFNICLQVSTIPAKWSNAKNDPTVQKREYRRP